MRRLGWQVLVLGLALGLAPRASGAAVELALSASARTHRLQPVEVILSAAVPAGTALGAIDAAVSWDPDQLALASVGDGDFASLAVNETSAARGELTLAAFLAGGKTGIFNVARLTFQDVAATADSARVQLSVSELTDAASFTDLLPQATATPCAVAMPAPPAIPIVLTAPDSIVAGSGVDISLAAHMPAETPLGAFEAEISWDPSRFTYVGVAPGAYAPLLVNADRSSEGRLTCSAYRAEGAQGDVSLGVLTLESGTSSSGSADVGVTVRELAAAGDYYADITAWATPQGCNVTVLPAPQVTVRLAGPDSVSAGDVVELRLEATLPADAPLGSFAVDMSWDPAQLSYLSLADGDFASLLVDDRSVGSGALSCAAFRPAGAAGQVLLGTLTLQATGQAAEEVSVGLAVQEVTAARDYFTDVTPWVTAVPAVLGVAAGAAGPTGDFSGDGKVDFDDFFSFADAFGGADPTYDLTGDGRVDFDDFFSFADAFAESLGRQAQGKLMALAAEHLGLPSQIGQSKAYPNPFNSATTISFTALRGAPVTLGIYDMLGRPVRELRSGYLPPGEHVNVWDGRDGAGRPVGSGVYLCRLYAAGQTWTQRVTLLK